MPFGDIRGPFGLGPKTRRCSGFYSGSDSEISSSTGLSRGWSILGRSYRMLFGCFGRGRGWRNWFWTTGLPGWTRGGYKVPYEITEKDEEDLLTREAEFLKKQLGWIESRLDFLRKKQEQTNE